MRVSISIPYYSSIILLQDEGLFQKSKTMQMREILFTLALSLVYVNLYV